MRQDRIRGINKNESGQSLVEFAITLPMLLLLLLGTIDIGMGFKTYISLTNAAREGVRWVSINPTDIAGAEMRIAQEAAGVGLSAGDIGSGSATYNVDFWPHDGPYSAGEKVRVTVSHNYPLLFGILEDILDSSHIPFEASATMVVLYDE